MKKFLAIFLSVLMLSTYCFAAAPAPEFLTQPMLNYTADYKITMSFDNSDEIVALLNELEMPEEITQHVDVAMLLESLFAGEDKIHIQLDSSEDFKKIQMGLSADTNSKIAVNQNLNVDINAKMGMWLDVDMSDGKLSVCDLVVISPLMNKYMVIDGAEFVDADDIYMVLSELGNFDFEKIQEDVIKSFMDNSAMTQNGNTYVFKMDNNGFANYLCDTIEIVLDYIGKEEIEDMDFSFIRGIKLLGEDGITTEVTLSNGVINISKLTADFSVDLAGIYMLLTGEEWPFVSADSIDFTVNMEEVITKVGQTKVDFPVLTEENSYKYEMPVEDDWYYDDDYYYEEEFEYPVGWFDNECEDLPVYNGEIYVPLRQCLESAYYDQITIGYDKGNITLQSDYFVDFEEIKFLVGEDFVYVDGNKQSINTPTLLIAGTTYVPVSFFEDIFGWYLDYATYDLVDGNFWYGFDTYSFEW